MYKDSSPGYSKQLHTWGSRHWGFIILSQSLTFKYLNVYLKYVIHSDILFGLVIDHKILRTGSQSHKNQVTAKKEKSNYHK